MGDPGDILFLSRTGQTAFSNPREVLSASAIDEVTAVLARAHEASLNGAWACGYVSYEAAPAFDPAMKCHAPSSLPLAWFGIYDKPSESKPHSGSYTVGEWVASLPESDYAARVQRIRDYIASGDSYQVNLAFPLRAQFRGDARAWFYDLFAAQFADYCAFMDLGDDQLVCVSPELFFELKNNRLRTRPMKGTRPRGRWAEEDDDLAAELHASEKERAENVMIVDLLRSDMGKISEVGSVQTRSLFNVEQYPTVWQMTSEIVSRTNRSVPEIFAALFPGGSVTGAPKIRTMQIIRDAEDCARGVYCGAMGWIAPGGDATFNIAIRCATISAKDGIAEYPVGGGITWSSSAGAEYAECLSKARVLSHARPPFELLESIRFDDGFYLLDEHMDRLAKSARYFGIPLRIADVRARLDAATQGKSGQFKIRLLVGQTGEVRIDLAPLPKTRTVALGFSTTPVDSKDIFLYHKTTHRGVYDRALAARTDCDDVLLWNERDEITESCTANVVVDMGGTLYTPPIACGLLPGALRASLLREGRIHERVLTRADVYEANAVHLVNSVRRWIPVDTSRLREPRNG